MIETIVSIVQLITLVIVLMDILMMEPVCALVVSIVVLHVLISPSALVVMPAWGEKWMLVHSYVHVLMGPMMEVCLKNVFNVHIIAKHVVVVQFV